MASIVIRELLTIYGYDVDDEAIKRGDAALANLKKTSIAITGVLAGAAAGMFALAKRTAQAGDEAAKRGKALGITAEEVQEIQYAAEMSGSSIGAMSRALMRLTRTTVAAQSGNEKARQTIQDLGIDIGGAGEEARSMADVFTDAVEALADIEDPAVRTAKAFDIFGRRGGDVLQTIEDGASDMRELRKEARQLGLVMTNDAAASAEAFNDAMTRLGAVRQGVLLSVGVDVMETMVPIIEATYEWALANRELISSRIDRAIKGVSTALRTAWRLIRGAVDGVQRLITAMGGLRRVLAAAQVALMVLVSYKTISSLLAMVRVVWGWVAALRAAGTAAALANAKAVLLPIIIAALGVLIWAVWEDFQAFYEGNESAIGELYERWPILGAAILALGEAIGEIWKAFRDLFNFFAHGITQSDGMIWSFGESIGDAVYDGVQAMKGWFSSFWAWLKNGFDGVVSWIVDAFWGIVDAVVGVGQATREKLESIPGLGHALKAQSAIQGGALDAGRRAAQGAGRLFQAARGRGSSSMVEGDDIDIEVVQRPGESQQELAERIEETLRRREDRKRRAMSRATTPGVLR